MEYTINDIKSCMINICDRILQIRDELTELDSRLGDGDMGISMEKGAAAVRAVVEEAPEDTSLMALLLGSASALNRAAPSTMGTLLSGALVSLAKSIGEKNVLTQEDVVMIPSTISQAIATRGKAQRGDKTILDALIPYADTLREAYVASPDLGAALKRAHAKAVEGMEGTKGVAARKGRASWLGERNKDYPDAGAVMLCRVTEIL